MMRSELRRRWRITLQAQVMRLAISESGIWATAIRTDPQDRGFHETLHHRAWGITSLADHWDNRKNAYFDPILEHNGTDKQYEGYCTDIFFGEAMKWIEQQTERRQTVLLLSADQHTARSRYRCREVLEAV